MSAPRPIKRRSSPGPMCVETIAERDFTPELRDRALTGLALLVEQEREDRAAARAGRAAS